MEENMHELGAINNHMLSPSVGKKGNYYCQFVLRLQEEKDID
jgi:hypothetical protein